MNGYYGGYLDGKGMVYLADFLTGKNYSTKMTL
jgi:hypothetical protein